MAGIKRPAAEETAPVVKKVKHEQPKEKPVKQGKGSEATNGMHESRLKNINTPTSREAHAKQKALAKERKASKPNADSIQRTKQLWERLRRKSHVEKEERKKMVDELFSIITGNIHDFVFKHDSVRVVQCALKYANEGQKQTIAEELKGHFRELAASKYGKFLVAKLLMSGNEQTKEVIISEFYGRVRHMINHPEASWILDDTYRQVATSSQKASLLREWYGPEFSIFKAAKGTKPTADLGKILEDNPEKRKPILKSLFDMINQLIQKGKVGYTMLHDAMLQYSLAIGPPSNSDASAEFLELLKPDTKPEAGGEGDGRGPGVDTEDLLKNLAFTASGARVLCRALAFSGAKDRKLMLRVFKDIVPDLAHDVHGLNVLLTAFEVIDDTVLTGKTIVAPLLGAKLGTDEEKYDFLLEEATSLTARVPLLYPFATVGKAKWLVQDQSESANVLDEIRGLRTDTSKKDPEQRRIELVKALSQGNVLLATVEHRADQLVQSSFGCQFITEVILGCETSKKAKDAAMRAIAGLAADDPTQKTHVSRSSHAGKMLRTLASGGKFDKSASKDGDPAKVPKEAPDRLGFAELLYAQIKDHLLEWATGENSFLIANYLEDKDFKEKQDVIKRLRKHKSALTAASSKGNKGAGLILKSM